jgi:hypothetical protein
MRYLIHFASSFIALAVFYYSLIFVLFPTPVAAEYWVRELLVFKRDIAKNLADQPKIIVASGSSTLFNIDTNILSDALKRPAINLGLMGGLPLDTILEEVNTVSKPGDLVIMALEPDYYCREANPGYEPWQIRNAIAWNYPFWQSKTFLQKLALIPALGVNFPLEMIQARLDTIFRPEILAPRLAALDDAQVVKKFSSRPAIPIEPIYSIYNMDTLGNVRAVFENNYKGPPYPADEDIKVCPQAFKTLSDFVSTLKSRKITVVFANTPFIAFEGLDPDKVNNSSKRFAAALKDIAPVIDERNELIFARDHFFDSVMHLNATGRELRTLRLLTHIQAQPVIQQSR